VTRSTGMSCVLVGSAAFKAAIRALASSSRAGLVGPRLEPEEDEAFIRVTVRWLKGVPKNIWGR